MFNCIESAALMDLCKALGLWQGWVDKDSVLRDVYIVSPGSVDYPEDVMVDKGIGFFGFKLSDYLLATAPVDVK